MIFNMNKKEGKSDVECVNDIFEKKWSTSEVCSFFRWTCLGKRESEG